MGVGTIGTMVGVGGGFLIVPIITSIEPHWKTQQITAFSLAVVAVNGVAGAFSYFRLKRIDLRSLPLYAGAALPGSVLGVFTSNLVPRHTFDLIFGMLLVLLAGWLFFAPERKAGSERGNALRDITDATGMHFTWRFPMPLALVGAMIVGFLSSFLGIGGGVVHVPFMVGVLGYPSHVATATSQGVLAITSLAGAVVHLVQGDYRNDAFMTLSACAGGLLGAPLGASLSQRVSGRILLRILALALAGTGARLILAGFHPR